MTDGIRQFLAKRKLRDYATGYAFVLPALAIYVFFVVYPFFYTIYLSLTKWDGAKPVKEFVGLLNYQELAADSRLWSALSHNFIWILLGTVAPVAIGLFLGVLLWRGVRGMVFFRTVYFLPVVLAPVAVGIIWKWMYNPRFGPINVTLKSLGLDFLAKGWMGDPYVALPALIFARRLGLFWLLLCHNHGRLAEHRHGADRRGAGRWRQRPPATVVRHHSRAAACANDDHRLYAHSGRQRF